MVLGPSLAEAGLQCFVNNVSSESREPALRDAQMGCANFVLPVTGPTGDVLLGSIDFEAMSEGTAELRFDTAALTNGKDGECLFDSDQGCEFGVTKPDPVVGGSVTVVSAR